MGRKLSLAALQSNKDPETCSLSVILPTHGQRVPQPCLMAGGHKTIIPTIKIRKTTCGSASVAIHAEFLPSPCFGQTLGESVHVDRSSPTDIAKRRISLQSCVYDIRLGQWKSDKVQSCLPGHRSSQRLQPVTAGCPARHSIRNVRSSSHLSRLTS